MGFILHTTIQLISSIIEYILANYFKEFFVYTLLKMYPLGSILNKISD